MHAQVQLRARRSMRPNSRLALASNSWSPSFLSAASRNRSATLASGGSSANLSGGSSGETSRAATRSTKCEQPPEPLLHQFVVPNAEAAATSYTDEAHPLTQQQGQGCGDAAARDDSRGDSLYTHAWTHGLWKQRKSKASTVGGRPLARALALKPR